MLEVRLCLCVHVVPYMLVQSYILVENNGRYVLLHFIVMCGVVHAYRCMRVAI